MKTFIAAMIALVLIIAFSLTYVYMLDNAMQTLISHTEQTATACAQQRWQDAETALDDFLTVWEKYEKYLASFIDHSEMDLINETLSSMKSYMQYQDTEESVVHANLLTLLFQHIADNEKFNLENILKSQQHQSFHIM